MMTEQSDAMGEPGRARESQGEPRIARENQGEPGSAKESHGGAKESQSGSNATVLKAAVRDVIVP